MSEPTPAIPAPAPEDTRPIDASVDASIDASMSTLCNRVRRAIHRLLDAIERHPMLPGLGEPEAVAQYARAIESLFRCLDPAPAGAPGAPNPRNWFATWIAMSSPEAQAYLRCLPLEVTQERIRRGEADGQLSEIWNALEAARNLRRISAEHPPRSMGLPTADDALLAETIQICRDRVAHLSAESAAGPWASMQGRLARGEEDARLAQILRALEVELKEQQRLRLEGRWTADDFRQGLVETIRICQDRMATLGTSPSATGTDAP